MAAGLARRATGRCRSRRAFPVRADQLGGASGPASRFSRSAVQPAPSWSVGPIPALLAATALDCVQILYFVQHKVKQGSAEPTPATRRRIAIRPPVASIRGGPDGVAGVVQELRMSRQGHEQRAGRAAEASACRRGRHQIPDLILLYSVQILYGVQ